MWRQRLCCVKLKHRVVGVVQTVFWTRCGESVSMRNFGSYWIRSLWRDVGCIASYAIGDPCEKTRLSCYCRSLLTRPNDNRLWLTRVFARCHICVTYVLQARSISQKYWNCFFEPPSRLSANHGHYLWLYVISTFELITMLTTVTLYSLFSNVARI